MLLPARFDKAAHFAAKAHEGQVRKFSGDPYVVHPNRCACRALRYGLSDNLVNAMLLHDVVEDCDVSIEEIADVFGGAVSAIVWGLTHCDARFGAKELGWNRAKRKAYDLMCLESQPQATREGKLIDLADNLDDWPADDKFLDVFLTEAHPLGLALARHGVHPDVVGDFLRVYGDAKLRRATYKTDHPKGGDA